MKLTVLGAGAWGTALAVSAAAQQATCLWVRDAAQAAQINADRCNARYLAGMTLPPALAITADWDRAMAHAQGGMLIVATPMAGLADILRRLPANAPPVVWLCKGFEDETGRLGHEIARELQPGLAAGILSGPSFALEVARGQPTALVAASTDAALCERVVEALHSESLRIYTSGDPIGVEVGGAVKNVLAIATGIADGMVGAHAGVAGLGLNARAALVTRGLAEMTRLGVALGGRAETFMGLSGLGDLVLTATGDLSRNRKVGLLLAQGLALPQILAELGHVAEGVGTAPMLVRRARALGVEMPIADAVAAVLAGTLTPARALEQLMGRSARPEA